MVFEKESDADCSSGLKSVQPAVSETTERKQISGPDAHSIFEAKCVDFQTPAAALKI